jgi:hypothetical protein
MRLLSALTCLLLACAIGYIFIIIGVDQRGGAWPISGLFFYGVGVVYALPFWLFTFLPLYWCTSSKSFVWRWYVSSIIGCLIGAVGSLILTKGYFDVSNVGIIRIELAPVIIGFSTFLLGTIFKNLTYEESLPPEK